MSKFTEDFLNNLFQQQTEYLNDEALTAIDSRERSINRRFFLTETSRLQAYLAKLYSDGKIPNDNYMLAFHVALDEPEVDYNFGLLTTVVDESLDHYLEIGDGHYFVVHDESNDKLVGNDISTKTYIVNLSTEPTLRDVWEKPTQYYTPNSGGDLDLKAWHDAHDIDACLRAYKGYQSETLMNLFIIHVSLWEINHLIERNPESDHLAILPVVMMTKFYNENLDPKEGGHFMSLLFIPMKKNTEGNLEINQESTPFLVSGKGYPRSWKENNLLHQEDSNETKPFSFIP